MIERIQQILQQSTAIYTHDGHFYGIVALVRLLAALPIVDRNVPSGFSRNVSKVFPVILSAPMFFHHVVHFRHADWPVDVEAMSGVMLPLARAW